MELKTKSSGNILTRSERSYCRQRATTVVLPNIEKRETVRNNSHEFKGAVENRPSASKRMESIEQWLYNVQQRRAKSNAQKTYFISKQPQLPSIKLHNSPNSRNYRAATTEANFYRSIDNRRLSLSTIPSLSVDSSRRSSFSSISIEEDQSILWSTSSVHENHLPSIQFNSLISKSDQINLNNIRQIIPEEFEKLVPILFQLGVLIVPNYFFQNHVNTVTTEQLIEKDHFVTLIEKQKRKFHYMHSIENLYGSVLPYHKHQLLRETFSFHGQLALATVYKDEIERELNIKLKYWQNIRINFVKTYPSDVSSLQDKSTRNIQDLETNSLLGRSFCNELDERWKTKCLANIIEQAMAILDQARSLFFLPMSSEKSSKQWINQYNFVQINVVNSYQRWLFLCSTLYSDYLSFI